MFLGLLHIEYDKVFKRRLPWVGLLVIVLCYLCYYLLLGFAFHRYSPLHGEFFSWPFGIVGSLYIIEGPVSLTSVGAFIFIVVIGIITGQEYVWHSLQLWLSQGVSRPALFAAKCAICLLTILLTTLMVLIMGIVTSIIASVYFHGNLNVNQVDWLQVFLSWLRVSYAAFPYTAMVLMLTVVTRSSVAAISITLLCAVVLEILLLPLSYLSPILRWIFNMLPLQLARSVNILNLSAVHIPVRLKDVYGNLPGTTPGQAAFAIAVYTVIFLGIALWVFCRQNLSESS